MSGLRFDLPADRRRVHEVTMPMRWGDMDALGHVNNTLYFRYMEIARMDWVSLVAQGHSLQRSGPLVVNAFCNFLRQLEFPGDLRVTMDVAQVGRSSFDTYHVLERCDQPGVVFAEGGSRVVWSDYAARRSAPLPDWLRTQLG